MISWSWTWACLPLAVSGVSLVLATYVLPSWQRRADARDNARRAMFEERRREADPSRETPECAHSPMRAAAEEGDVCEQVMAADLEMLRRVSQWRDARRGKDPVRRD